MNIPDSNGKPPRAGTMLLAATAIGLAAVFMPFALPVASAFFAYVMCKTKPAFLALFGGVFALGALLLYGGLSAACLTAITAGIAAALYALQTRKVGNAYTVATVSGIALLALYALICLPGILSGEGAFSLVEAVARDVAGGVKEFLASVPDAEAEAAQLNEYIDVYLASIPTLVVPVLAIFAAVTGFGSFLLFRAFARNKGLSLTLLPAFRFWKIPGTLATGLIVMLAGSLLLDLIGWDYAEALTNAVNTIVGMPLMLQGLCVLDFMLVRRGGNVTTRRVLVYIATGLFLWAAQMPLVVLGCLEQILRFRARTTPPPSAQSL